MPIPPSSLTALIHASNRTRDCQRRSDLEMEVGRIFWNLRMSHFSPKNKLEICFNNFESQCIITVSCLKSCKFWMNPPESVEDREMSRLEYWNI